MNKTNYEVVIIKFIDALNELQKSLSFLGFSLILEVKHSISPQSISQTEERAQ